MRLSVLSAAIKGGRPFVWSDTVKVARVEGLTAGGYYSYGFRKWGSYTFGTMPTKAVENAIMAFVMWHAQTNRLTVAFNGDQRATLRLKKITLGPYELDLSNADVSFTDSQSLTGWNITLTGTQMSNLNALLNTSPVIGLVGEVLSPVLYSHRASMVVGVKTIANYGTYAGYRSNRDNPIGSLTPVKFLGQADILFANWNITTNQLDIILDGNRDLSWIKQVEIDSIVLEASRRLVAQYESGSNWTRYRFDTTGLVSTLTSNKNVVLKC